MDVHASAAHSEVAVLHDGAVMDYQDASRRSSYIAALAACSRIAGAKMLDDGWPGFKTRTGWRFRVVRSGTVWVAMHHGRRKIGLGAWPEQAQEQAMVKEF